jgi:hypothetical protein
VSREARALRDALHVGLMCEIADDLLEELTRRGLTPSQGSAVAAILTGTALAQVDETVRDAWLVELRRMTVKIDRAQRAFDRRCEVERRLAEDISPWDGWRAGPARAGGVVRPGG